MNKDAAILSHTQIVALYVLLHSQEGDLDRIQAGVLELLRDHLYQRMSVTEFENIFHAHYLSVKKHE